MSARAEGRGDDASAASLARAETVAGLREVIARWREAGDRVALVPTMGNLHAGHLSLVARAAAECERVVVSIFVNPLQFGAGEDFSAYPRTPADDALLLAGTAADLLFTPSVAQMYPFGEEAAVRITVPGLSDILCGEHRPGHFTGVASVVARLLTMANADVAVFGEKDLQQLRVIERLAQDLHLPTRVLPAPTVREADGLAMSSRNRYLDVAERARAPALYRELSAVAAALRAGAAVQALPELEAEAVAALRRAGFRPDYVAIRRSGDLARPAAGDGGPFAVLGAARLGRARLIDNVQVEGPALRG